MSGEIWSFIDLGIAGKLTDISRKITSEAKRAAQILGGVPCGVLAGSNLTQPASELERFGLQKLYLLLIEAGQENPEAYTEALLAAEARWSFLHYEATLGWKRIKKAIPPAKIGFDRAPMHEEIARLLSVAELRIEAASLIWARAGWDRRESRILSA